MGGFRVSIWESWHSPAVFVALRADLDQAVREAIERPLAVWKALGRPPRVSEVAYGDVVRITEKDQEAEFWELTRVFVPQPSSRILAEFYPCSFQGSVEVAWFYDEEEMNKKSGLAVEEVPEAIWQFLLEIAENVTNPLANPAIGVSYCNSDAGCNDLAIWVRVETGLFSLLANEVLALQADRWKNEAVDGAVEE